MKKKLHKRGFSRNFGKLVRTTFLLVFTSIITVSASTYSQNQRISLNMKDVTVKDIIDAIEQQSEFIFFYKDQAIDLGREVSIDVKKAKIQKIMGLLLKGTSSDYLVDNRQVIIAKGKMALFEMKQAVVEKRTLQQAQQLEVTGTITDEYGQPLPGASVIEKGTNNGVQTDFDGNFSINVANERATLIVSYIGFSTKEIAVGNQTSMTIALEEDVAGLDEVIVMGYGGSQAKRDITGAVSSVSKEVIAQRSSAGAMDALQGTVAGLQFNRSSGQVGNNEAIIRIRGTSTLNAGASPLYVVDGVEVPTIGDINPDDIASLEVLKDASSASIYGARSANGVILITTKKGTMGRPTIKLNYQHSINTTAYDYPQSNLEDWRAWDIARTNAYNIKRGSSSIRNIPADSLSPWSNSDYYHQDALFEPGHRDRVGLNISNATEKFSYYFNVDAIKEKQPLISGDYKQINTRLNLGYKASKAFSIRNNFSLSYANTEGANVSSAFQTMLRIRPGQAMYDDQGEVLPASAAAILLHRVDSRHNFNIMEQLAIDLKISDNLKFESRGNISLRYNRSNSFENAMVRGYRRGVPRSNRGSESQNFNVNSAWDNFITYKPKFDEKQNLTLMLGTNTRMSNTSRIRVRGDLFPTDAVITLNAAGELVPNGTDSQQGKTTSSALFGRLIYDYDSRYLFQMTMRRDGNSKFGSENRRGIFPSSSFAWRFSNESFFDWASGFLTDGKIRTSWGISGNSNFGANASISTYATDYSYGAEIGVGPRSLGNPDLSWEETTQTNYGIDLTLFKGRLSITADYYNKQTNDLLYGVQTPKTTGYSTVTKNIGKIENKGWELSIAGHAFRKRAISWDVSLTLSQNKNKVLELADHTPFFTGRDQIFYYREGHAMGEFYGFKALGIYSYDESNAYTDDWQQLTPVIDQKGNDDPWDYDLLGYEINGQPYTGNINKKTVSNKELTGGDVIWDDLDNNGIIDDEDRQALGNALPDIYGGLHNRINYKGLSLSFLFSFQFGNEAYGHTYRRFRDGFHWSSSTPHPEHLSWYWAYPGYDAKYPLGNKRWKTGRNNRAQSSLWIQDASYIQLSNVRLDYRIPKKLTDKLGLSGISLFALANNVAIWSNYTAGPDPSVIGGGGFNTIGIDVSAVPLMRQYNFGLNINF